MPNLERLIVASSPFQEFIMTTRRVYRWENRTETTKYLLIFLTLWGLNLLLPGVVRSDIETDKDHVLTGKALCRHLSRPTTQV